MVFEWLTDQYLSHGCDFHHMWDRMNGENRIDGSGSSVSDVGDVNGDGFDDVSIGVDGASSSYVVFGKASGLDAISHGFFS